MVDFPSNQQKADKALGDATYDWALPQSWWDYAHALTLNNPAGEIVWLYKKGSCFGQPYALSLLGHIMLQIIALKETRQNG